MFTYSDFRGSLKNKSISLIQLQNSQQDMQADQDEWTAAQKQVDIDRHSIATQEQKIKSIKAELNIAEVNLRLTNVRSQRNGVIQNLFCPLGAPININRPLFSLVNTDEIYIQANFNETDLRDVRHGSKVSVYPRMYLERKRHIGARHHELMGQARRNFIWIDT